VSPSPLSSYPTLAAEPAGVVERCLVVVNPVSRRGATKLLDNLREQMPSAARLTIVETTTTPLTRGSLEEVANNVDLVVAVGGDGTVAETLTAIDRSRTPVGIMAGDRPTSSPSSSACRPTRPPRRP
jgi:hypothetical protein